MNVTLESSPRISVTFRERPIPRNAGIGLRLLHQRQVIEHGTSAAWLEVHPENYLDRGSLCDELEIIRQDHPLSFHRLGLPIGSSSGPDAARLSALLGLVQRFSPGLISDHLSWSPYGDAHSATLIPLPYTEESLAVVSRNVARSQDFLRRRLLLENPPTCWNCLQSPECESQFLAEVVRRTGCGVLLDINNIYVSSRNRGWSPSLALARYLERIAKKHVAEIHLAGHAVYEGESGAKVHIDDHGSPVAPEVWGLYEQAVATLGPKPTLIEWDVNLPPLELLEIEAATAQSILNRHSRSWRHTGVY
jgi:uncharacterized protein